jgi:hypothetical protein
MPGLVLPALAWHPTTQAHTQERLLCFMCFHGLQWGCDVTRQPRRKQVLVRKGKLRSEDEWGDAPPVLAECDYCVHIPTLEPVYVTTDGYPVGRARDPVVQLPTPAARPAAPVTTTPVETPAPAAEPEEDETGQRGLFG